MLNTTTLWAPNTTTADPTDVSTSYNASVYPFTTLLDSGGSLGPVDDGMNTLSSVMPSVSPDPLTVLGSEGSLTSTLAASLVTVATLSK